MIVDLELEIDGMNCESLLDVEELIRKIEQEIDSIYPVHYIVRYCES